MMFSSSGPQVQGERVRKIKVERNRLEAGSEDGGGTDTEEDVLAQGVGTAGRGGGGSTGVGAVGAGGGRGRAAGLGHGGGSEDSDNSGGTHFEGLVLVVLGGWFGCVVVEVWKS